jgi:hypothetical protein
MQWLYLIIAVLLCTLSSLFMYVIGFQKGYNLRVDEYNALAASKTRDVPIFVTEDKNIPQDKVYIMGDHK